MRGQRALLTCLATLGNLYRELGDEDVALETLQAARGLIPAGDYSADTWYVRNGMALIYQAQGQLEKAEGSFRRSWPSKGPTAQSGRLRGGHRGKSRGPGGERGNTLAAFKYFNEANDFNRFGYGYLMAGDLGKSLAFYKR